MTDAKVDREQIVWIVVSSHHYWGAANSLHEAMRRANLPEPMSPAEWFAEEIEFRFDLDHAVKEWNDYGKSETKQPSGDVHTILIYKFDPFLWSDYRISPIDGSVSFTQKEGVNVDFEAEMEKAWIAATYKDGVLSPVKK